MHRFILRHSAYVFLVGGAASVGCGGRLDTTAVTGNVTYQGEPLEDGRVTFYPDQGHPISTSIDSAGDYTVELPAGQYRVTVQGPGINVPKDFQGREGERPSPPPPELVLPAEYSTRAKTMLQVTVNEGGPQNEDFHLD